MKIDQIILNINKEQDRCLIRRFSAATNSSMTSDITYSDLSLSPDLETKYQSRPETRKLKSLKRNECELNLRQGKHGYGEKFASLRNASKSVEGKTCKYVKTMVDH